MLSDKEIQKFNKLMAKDDKRLSIIFNALSDPKRCKIYRLFIKSKDEDLCVSDIAQIMEISIPSASQHLKILEITGLLSKERRGQKTVFSLNSGDQVVNALVKAVL